MVVSERWIGISPYPTSHVAIRASLTTIELSLSAAVSFQSFRNPPQNSIRPLMRFWALTVFFFYNHFVLALIRPTRRAAISVFPAAVVFKTNVDVCIAISLRDELAARNALLLKRSLFNTAPRAVDYPAWLEGRWRCSEVFAGFEFPARVPKEEVVADTNLAGFTKLSIVRFADIGRKSTTSYEIIFADSGGVVVEDVAANLKSSIAAHTDGREVVESVEYASSSNPNRLTLRLKPGSRNGERVELFVNGRRSEVISDDVFISSELIRQVTLGKPTLQNPGVAKMVIGEYQHYFTWRRVGDGQAKLNVLTAVYVDAQEDVALFTKVGNDPVIVYSHDIIMERVALEQEQDRQ